MERMKHEQICPRCGKTFTTESTTKIFCSKLCRDRWNQADAERRVDLRIPENRKKLERFEHRSPEWHAQLHRMREDQAADIKKRASEAEKETKSGDLKRTKSGAVWYPKTGAEIMRIARETHRTYGEVCSEFLSQQVRVGG